ncbi:class I SAM-dependent rRNA methyltransferase [Marinilabilia rubra]|uniref:RlmI/RlmK family 23S rRNA methyltransferase n=1 Tax=Marinilabilia rubra TaxID=2162893 RepID=A0A2U2B698_9BACT|nr:class I SAM-dependent rRNA methyltransferase [Marinilabilia rubra]PWD98576.1 RlmI/RlmK family 23S rRNA methyltransferase [Marinilabilia rubra]
MEFATITLKPGKEQSVQRFHPWVFSGAIKAVSGEIQEGDVVDVMDHQGNYLATGHSQIGAIAVRIFSFSKVIPDQDFWTKKIKNALELRNQAGLTDCDQTNAFRLIYAEGDGIPGLIVDMYNGTAIMQIHTVGMYLIKEILCEALKTVLGDKLKAIYNKSEGAMPFKAEVQPENGFLWGKTTDKTALENGLLFNVDYEKGQKTGFFLDQRENRALLERYSQGKKVLNLFCYTGGFSFYALRGGAELVHSVDSSERAIELTNENVHLNFPEEGRHKAFAEDAFKFLNKSKEEYDLIILDPPAFAKHQNVVPNALQGYRKLNAKAIRQIKPGGIIFTFSCSQVITRDAFRKAVFTAAAKSGRHVRIIHQMEQPADHPVNIYHPESEYLKGLVIYVE